jgi:NADH-quinone oxidoreductase subunit L
MLTAISVFAPLLGAVIAGLARPFISKSAALGASVACMIISATAGIFAFVSFAQSGVPVAPLHIATWISVGSFTPDWVLRQDALSLVMVADPHLQHRLHGA